MAFFNNHTLALDALGTSGCVIPTEQRAALDTSLVIKKAEAGLLNMSLWGRVFTMTGKDYLVAQGCNSIQVTDNNVVVNVKSYYSLDGAKWLDLQPLSDDAYDICKTIQGGFKGDPSQMYKALVPIPPAPPAPPAPQKTDAPPAEGENPDAPKVEEVEGEKPPEVAVTTDNQEEEEEEEEEGEEGEKKKKKKKKDANMKTVVFGELDRLSALIRSVDYECGVMPVDALILNARKQLVPNTLFSGVKFPEKLDSYGHLYQRYEDSLLSKDINGSWSVQMAPITGDVILRSLWWPGYSFYYNVATKSYGSLYFGTGDKNMDFGFMIG